MWLLGFRSNGRFSTAPPKKRESGEAMRNQKQKQMCIAVQAGVEAAAGTACFGESLTRALPLREEMLHVKAEASGTCIASGPQFGMSGMPLLCNLHP